MSGDLMQRLENAKTHRGTFTKGDLSLTDGTENSRTEMASIQVKRAHALLGDSPVDLSIVAYETKTADGTGGDQETFTLSHNPVDSNATAQPVVAYEGNSRLSIDSVDYAANTVTVTPANASSTIGFFYASGEQAQVEIRKEAPGNKAHRDLFVGDLSILHMRDHGKEPLTFDFSADDPLAPIVPKDWSLKVYVDAPYPAYWAADVGGDGNEEQAINALVGIDYRAAVDTIEGLPSAVARNAAEA